MTIVQIINATFRRGLWAALPVLSMFNASPALGVQECAAGSKSINLSNGASTEHLTATVICTDDGKKQREEDYRDGKQTGMRFYYDNGKLKHEEFKDSNGNVHGLVRDYFENGKIEAEEHREHGASQGAFKHYYPSGHVDRLGSKTADGQTTSLAFSEDGHLTEIECSEASFNKKDRELCGYLGGPHKVTIYSSKGLALEELTYEKGKVIQTRAFDHNGKVAKTESMASDRKDGIIVERFPNGKTKQEKRYNKDGQFNGPQREFAESGQKTREAIFENGFMTSETIFYLNGQKKRTSVREQKASGAVVQAKEFWDNGKAESAGVYVEVERTEDFGFGDYWSWTAMHQEGVFHHWRKDGTIESEENYQGGERNGISRIYFADGKKVAAEDTYKAGALVRSKRYDANGKLKLNEEYFSDGSKKQYRVAH